MNHLEGVRELKNNYILMRHGRSVANNSGVIISDPYVATDHFGLILNGVIEARFSAMRANNQRLLDPSQLKVIFTSDFRRHRETAQIVKRELGGTIVESKELRERYFGRWEGKSHRYYEEEVWPEDAINSGKRRDGVESLDDVQTRMTALVRKVEEEYKDCNIVFVSSGDPLQILETAFRQMDPRRHRELESLKTGEIRQVFLATKSLPRRAPGQNLPRFWSEEQQLRNG